MTGVAGLTVAVLGWKQGFPPVLSPLGGLAALAGFLALRKQNPVPTRLLLLLAAQALFSYGATTQLMPMQARERVIRDALLQAGPALDHAGLAVVGPKGAVAEFYAGRPLIAYASPAEAWAAIKPGQALMVITSGDPPVPPDLPGIRLAAETHPRLRCDIALKP